MCLIIHKESGRIPSDILEYAAGKNPDGFGLAWRTASGIQTERFAPEQRKQFLRRAKKAARYNTEVVVHCRLATHGSKTKKNCHPFEYNDRDGKRVLMFHNGIIDIATDKQADETDSYSFARQVLSQLEPQWWNIPAQRFLVEAYIGWSRILLMTDEETVRLQGLKEKWIQREGIGYSAQPDPPTKIVLPAKTSWQPVPSGTMPSGAVSDYGRWSFGTEKKWQSKTEPPKTFVRYDKGHTVVVSNVQTWGKVGDKVGEAKCKDCQQEGEYFDFFQGDTYIDIEHDRAAITDEEYMRLWGGDFG